MKSNINLFIAGVVVLLTISFLQVNGENNVRFFNMNEEYGISIRETNQVLKDDNGFIWMASKHGVLRYMEDDIRNYQLPFDSEDIITLRLVYKKGVLYAYTNNGQILRYNPIQDKFEMDINASKELRNPHLLVSLMLVDVQGRMWLASNFGLYCYDTKNGLKSFIQSKNIQYAEWFDSNRFFYVADGQINLFNTLDLSSAKYYGFPKETEYAVSCLLYDQKFHTLWIGTMADGLYYLCNNNGDLKLSNMSEIPNQPVLAIEANSDSTMLVGIDGQGIWKINKYHNEVKGVYKENSDDPHSLKGNGVYDIYCDDNKRVWICTYSGGVSYFDQAISTVTEITHIVNNPNSLVNNDVNGVLEDSDGNIWFATNNGVSYWNVSTNRWKSFYHNEKEHAQVFHDLCEDDQGRIWAGSYSSGVYLIDRKSGKELKHYSFEKTGGKFNSNFVFDIYKDSQGHIWIGGVRGDLICYLSQEDRFISFKDFTVKVMMEYRPGQLLFGTTFGLLILDTKTGITNRLVEGYLVNDMLLKEDVIWLCTGGNGVVKYNIKTKTIKNFSFDSGLPSNFVNGISFSKGHFWIGTEHGLFRMNEDGDSILTYNSSPSLSNVSFNQNAHYNLKNGKLIWGTNKGALLFDPATIKNRQSTGRIFYQNLTISGRSIRESLMPKLNSPLDSLQELSLEYYQNTISLEMIPIGVNLSGLKFSWKLEGLDKEWSMPVNNRILSYSNIPSGNYTLRIRLIDNSLTNIIEERAVILRVIPPIWEKWWFKYLIAFFAIGLVFFLFAYYIDRLKKQHTEEKIRFFTNTAHDIRTSLTLIKAPVEELGKEKNLTESGKYYLNLAIEQARQLTSVVTQLMDFQKADIGKEQLVLSIADIIKLVSNRKIMLDSYAKSKNIELIFVTDRESYTTAIDESKMEKIIDNLISNAIKYSPNNSRIEIELKFLAKKWIFQVKDNGIGIGKKAQRFLFKEFYRGDNAINSKVVGSGIGLLLVKNYVTMHGGNIVFSSQEDVGSTFQVVIPFNSVSEDSGVASIRSDISNFSSSVTDSFQHAESENEIQASKEMKVLIVEDNDDLLAFLKSTLSNDFKVYTAVDGEKAWEFIAEQIPDLVVSDIMMPNMDGFELCKIMKSTYETSHIPIVLLTALSEKTDQLHGLGLGADDYLMKPFDMNLLIQRIKSIVRNREVVREKALKLIKGDSTEHILANDLNDKFVKKMLEVVWANISNTKFDKDEFASAMNVSSSLLYKKIKSLTNQSPSDFIKTVRLNHAVELLQSRKYTVTEVSELCGFASLTYFGVVFKKHFGKSPSEI